MDISEAIKAKSDQLNASDLIGGSIVARIEAVKRGDADQPVVVQLAGGHMPWKPSKTALRAMAHFLGTATDAWIGRWVRLYRDPRTLWAGKPVGGVMVSGLDGIKGESLNLPYSRGKTHAHKIDRIDPGDSGAPTADLHAFLDEHGIKMAALDAWCESKGRPKASEMDAAGQSRVASYLAIAPDAVAVLVGGAG